jgi:MoaA/NifB/PqqE/SkfB family radical SAM enzyme
MKPLCIVPWTSIDISPRGSIAPCCKIQSKHEDKPNILNQSITEYTTSDFLRNIKNKMTKGEWPIECIRCKTEEDNGIKSKRILDYERWKTHWDTYTEDKGYIVASIAFGNTCNLKCITCKSSSSSRWRKEYNDIYGIDRKPVETISAGANEIYNAMSNVIHFDIPGGEPLLSEISKQKTLLQKYVDSGQSKYITLHYTTNAQLFPSNDWWKLWHNFAEVDIQLSVDGVGRKYEYIRYPARNELLEESIIKYKDQQRKTHNLKISVSHTISAYNIYYLSEFFDWCTAYGLPKPWCGAVHNPKHMRPTVFPNPIREKIANHLKTSRHEDVRVWGNFLDNNDSSEYYQEFLTRKDQHDLYRNLNFAETFSQVEELINGV